MRCFPLHPLAAAALSACLLALPLAACDDGAGTDPTPDVPADLADNGPADVPLPSDPGPADPAPEVGPDVPADVPPDLPGDAPVDVPPDAVPSCAAGSQTVTFVHVNDIHARYTPDPEGNKLARVSGYAAQVRAENPFTIFSDGGDDHEKGCVAEQMSAGRSTLEVIRALGFDIRVPGNHDFAWSLDEFLEHTRDPRARVVLSNVTYTGRDASRYGAVPWTVMEVGCLKVGFFGLVSGPWNDQDQSFEGDFYPETPTRFDYDAIVRQFIDDHRSEVDLLVLVSHLGRGADEALAATIPGLDVILGGHSHSSIPELEVIGDAAIVQSASGADFITRLDVTLDLASRRVVDRRHEFVLNLPGLQPLDEALDATLAEIVGRLAPETLVTAGWLKAPRVARTLSDLAARAALESLDADAALLDPDTTWSGLRTGPLRPEDLHAAYLVEREPAGSSGFSSLVIADITGADLAKVRDGKPEWSYLGPDVIDPSASYRLATQKRTAARPDRHLPDGATVTGVLPRGEVWEALHAYAKARTAECLYIDVDEALPDCPATR